MKTRFPSILGVFAAILMVASFVVPMNIAAPAAVTADPGIMKWDTVSTPGSVSGKNDVYNYHRAGSFNGLGSDIISMAVGNDGVTIAMIARGDLGALKEELAALPLKINGLLYSNNSGISGTLTRELGLLRNPNFGYQGITYPPLGIVDANPTVTFPVNLYQVAIAPDDPKVIAVTADYCNQVNNPLLNGFNTGPRRIYYTTDAGQNWDLAFNGGPLGTSSVDGLNAAEFIRNIDISIDYGGKRDIGFVTNDATGVGRWFVRSTGGFNTWQSQVYNGGGVVQPLPIATPVQYMAIKFSPTYSGDSSVALVYATNGGGADNPLIGTFFNVAFRDLNTNFTLGWAYGDPGIKLYNSTLPLTPGAAAANLNNVSLQLPSDFSGQSSSLRRAYISLDAYRAVGLAKSTVAQDGIYRVDDTTVYVLMDTTNTATKSIYTIAYFGTYASGKLLAGERMGFPCTATVPTWFTDSPTTCPIPCWYPALKPTTGAANQDSCLVGSQTGYGSALVAWNVDGSLGYAATGSNPTLPYTTMYGPLPVGFWYNWGFKTTTPNDESAFAISRNNGETWNQILAIDTTIDWFNDVAIAPDCTTIYLASANRNGGLYCNEFDSVWRSTINPNVAAPLPAVPPLGTYWERVFTHTTSGSCRVQQSDLPILRVVPSCTDKADGEIVGWAAQGANATTTGTKGGVMAWSPDYGDYWAMITPRYVVQDFAFESSTTLYVVNYQGAVQRLPYTGTAWSTNLPTYDTTMLGGHTIVAVPDGKVLVGANADQSYQAAYSADKGVTFMLITDSLYGNGNEHVIFDVDFKNNNFIYMGDDNLADPTPTNPGTVYRNTVPSFTRWSDNDMMSSANGGKYIFDGIAELNWPASNNPPHPVGQFGIAQAWTGDPQPALYSAHAPVPTSLAKMKIDAGPDGGITGIAPTITTVTTGTQNTVSTTTVSLGGSTLGDLLDYNPKNSAVCRTLKPREGMPKPGINWDCLDIFTPLATTGIRFTLEPTSLKYCGCCTLDTNTTLYAIDDMSNGSEDGALLNPGTVSTWTETGGRFWQSSKVSPLATFAQQTTALTEGLLVARFTAPWVGYAPAWKRGMLWAYTDCLAKKGPILKTPADKFLVGADPVTGRNQQIDLAWEQLCLSTWYQLQIAKDAAFTLRINPQMSSAGTIGSVTGSILLKMDSTNMTSPAAWIAPGALPEAGAIYYWRIRSAKSATAQIAASPWSEVRSFTVKAGFIVNTPYYGVQLLAPNNGCLGCKVKPASFSWSPWKEATKYQFDLATDPEFKSLVVTATTTTTGYEYSGTLNYSTNYFWRVKALEVNGQNIPSDWSATFSLQTEPAPAPPAPPPAEPATPVWVWVIIAIGAILVIVTLVLIFKTRRV